MQTLSIIQTEIINICTLFKKHITRLSNYPQYYKIDPFMSRHWSHSRTGTGVINNITYGTVPFSVHEDNAVSQHP